MLEPSHQEFFLYRPAHACVGHPVSRRAVISATGAKATRLAAERPASFVGSGLLAADGADLRPDPVPERRKAYRWAWCQRRRAAAQLRIVAARPGPDAARGPAAAG